MKVENQSMREILARYAEQADAGKARAAQPKKPEARQADEVVVSDRARELQRIHQRLDEIEKARAEKVEAIRRDLESGTYRVNGDAVARKLVRPPSEQPG